jgi:hypothetical protein
MLLLWIAGCAEPLLVVPDSDWHTVPATQRDALDKQQESDLAAARAELAAASASLAAFQRAPAPPRAASTIKADPNDAWARDHERARADALARVDAAVAEVQRTDLAWRRLRVDAANARIKVVISQREVSRAQAIDHNLPGTDHYDIAPLRGQFSRIQQRWYAVSNSANTAREAFERANTSLASAKAAYAQVMRGGPLPPPEAVVAVNDHAAHLELPGWAITRSDIRRRRGLRHFLDDAGTTPQLRKVAFQLSRIVRATPPPAPSPPTPPSPTPPISDSRGSTPPAPGGPADRASNPSPSAAAANARPAATPRGPAAATVDHPADRAGDPSPRAALSSSARRGPEAPRSAPLAVPAPTPAMSASGKPAEPPRGSAPAKPTPQAAAAEHPPSPQVAAPSAPLAGKPGASHPSPPPAPTGAAKPVQRPAPEPDARAH